MGWVLLLRAVNLGSTNKLAMKDLTAVLEGLGHQAVRTYLNSGNATFTSSARSAQVLAGEVEGALADRLDLHVRACVRTEEQIARALDELPDLPGYVTVNVLFDEPTGSVLTKLLRADWSPEVVEGNGQVLYVGFQNAARTMLTNARIEKALGVSCTARTPATLRRLLAR